MTLWTVWRPAAIPDLWGSGAFAICCTCRVASAGLVLPLPHISWLTCGPRPVIPSAAERSRGISGTGSHVRRDCSSRDPSTALRCARDDGQELKLTAGGTGNCFASRHGIAAILVGLYSLLSPCGLRADALDELLGAEDDSLGGFNLGDAASPRIQRCRARGAEEAVGARPDREGPE